MANSPDDLLNAVITQKVETEGRFIGIGHSSRLGYYLVDNTVWQKGHDGYYKLKVTPDRFRIIHEWPLGKCIDYEEWFLKKYFPKWDRMDPNV